MYGDYDLGTNGQLAAGLLGSTIGEMTCVEVAVTTNSYIRDMERHGKVMVYPLVPSNLSHQGRRLPPIPEGMQYLLCRTMVDYDMREHS